MAAVESQPQGHMTTAGSLQGKAFRDGDATTPSEAGVAEDGGERMAAQYGVPLLGSLPLQIGIREQGDAGTPITVAQPDSVPAQAYRHAAQRLIEEVGKRPRASIPILSSLL